MPAKKKKIKVILEITEGNLKAIKCLAAPGKNPEVLSLEAEVMPENLEAKKMAELLRQVFKKIDYAQQPLIAVLPRNHATCRYLKVPSTTEREIENIASLQASRYLPYPANELITGTQIISSESDGYSGVNLTIVHRDIVNRYAEILRQLNIKEFAIVLSSYGLCNLFSYFFPEEARPAMVINLDTEQVDLVVAWQQKMIFSRYFKLNQKQPGWETIFAEELERSRDAYLKEFSSKPLERIILLGGAKKLADYSAQLKDRLGLPVEAISLQEKRDKLVFAAAPLNRISALETSFASLLGLGVKDFADSLNLLPRELKEKTKKAAQYQQQLKNIFFILGIVAVWALVLGKNLDNQAKYLERLKQELGKISQEAKPLEEIDRRYKILESQSAKKTSGLDLLYGVSACLPKQVFLTNFSYEENKELILRGVTPELNSVFLFVNQLEKAPLSKDFSFKVRYATKKKTQAGEAVNFEIACVMK